MSSLILALGDRLNFSAPVRRERPARPQRECTMMLFVAHIVRWSCRNAR